MNEELALAYVDACIADGIQDGFNTGMARTANLTHDDLEHVAWACEERIRDGDVATGVCLNVIMAVVRRLHDRLTGGPDA